VTAETEEPLNFTDEPEVRGAVAVIPGRNIFVVRGTEEQLRLIKKFIELADRPPFQVIIRGLVYTANVDRLRDIGVQTTIVDGKIIPDRVKPEGTFLGISSLTGLFDFSTLIGTVDFNVQASALQRNGIISIKSRPFAIVLDGDKTDLEVGRQIPVLTQGSVVGGDAGNLEFIGASSLLSVTPHVMDDDNGNPIAVNLELQIESNEVDTAVISQDLPSINRRSINSRLILTQDKTVVLGGFTIDSVNDSVSKVPGLGDIPLLGYLFKRKVRQDQVNRLYFAISVTVVPYGQVLEPVIVPGATTEIPSVNPEVMKRENNLKKRDQ
jgi:type II secretory pathway component GspD/PulD (secretin)